MSFLLPSLRHSLRNHLRNNANVLRQQITPRHQPVLRILGTPRAYSNGKDQGPSRQNSESQQQDPETTSQSVESEESSPLKPKSPEDLGTGDIHAAPGSILSQYTLSPQEQAGDLATTESESGQPLKREEYISSADRKRERMMKISMWGFLFGLVGGGVYLGRPLEEEERERMGWAELPSGHSPTAYWRRFQKRGKFMLAFFNEPAFEKLLPPPAPEPYGRPYTLLLDLDELLIHSEWTREHGWRTAKRPGLDYFLGYLSQFYEIVIFSKEYATFAGAVVAKLDPYHNSLSGALFRESTRYIDGKVVKDLSFINRDLEKVVLVDTNPDSYILQPENAIPMKKWKGDIGDKGLVALLPFLEYLGSQNFKDLRPIIKEYVQAAEKRNISVAEEFARREAIARDALAKTLKPAPQEASGQPFVSRLFGLRALPPVQSTTPQPGEIVTPLDIMRQQATEGYEAMKKYIDEHAEEILEEDRKREQQMLGEQKMSLAGFIGRFSGGVPPPTDDKKGDSK